LRDLWISKITGRHRTGTRVSELRKLFGDGITAQSICEPIQACFINDPVSEIKEKMEQLDFDVIGIKSSEDSPIEGYIFAADLTEGKCGDFKKEFQISDLISNSTPLIDVLQILKNKMRVFVLFGNMIQGIITRADLQKPPVRILLFGLITLLEMHFSYLIRKFYPDENWHGTLTESRIEKAKELMRSRKERNEKLDLVDCFQFCDKRNLILAISEIINLLGFSSEDECKNNLKDIEKLRDKLAHSQDIVTGTSWEKIISLVDIVEKLIQKSEKYTKNILTNI
jgi:AraC-like DNA-binding protein